MSYTSYLYPYLHHPYFLGTAVLKRWKHLRDAFIRSQKKIKLAKSSGSHSSRGRTYIFSKEMQFLKKVYSERETEESFNAEDVSADEPIDVQPKLDSTTDVSKPDKQPKRQKRKIDDVDLKISEPVNKEPAAKNDKWAFFESLLRHVDKLDNNQWLQCQIEILQVISKIKNPTVTAPHVLQTHSNSLIQHQHQILNLNSIRPLTIPRTSPNPLTSNLHLQHSGNIPYEMNQMPSSAGSHNQTMPKQECEEDLEITRSDNAISPVDSVASCSSRNSIDFNDV